MKVNDILKKINDLGLYIEIIELPELVSLGVYHKNDAHYVYNKVLQNRKVKKINVRYYEEKRVLVLGVE